MVSRVVTPEAVLVELPTAGAGSRGLARLFDLFVNGIVVSMVSGLLSFGLGATGVSTLTEVAVAAFAITAYMLILPIGSEILWRGRSLGKAVMGLKVVGVDGSRETVSQVMVRGMVALVDIFGSLGVLALGASVLSESGQRLGDMAAGTVVIRSRTADRAMVPIAFHPPPGLEAYVNHLPVGRLGDEDFVVVRDYLLRARQLAAGPRQELALELSDRIGSLIGVDRPIQIDPQIWLVCIASAHQMQPGGLLFDAARGLAPLAPVAGTSAR